MLEIILEIIIQLFVEFLAGAVELLFRNLTGRKSMPHKMLFSMILIAVLGFVLGLISLEFYGIMIQDHQLRLANLLITPVVIGLIMRSTGQIKDKRGRRSSTLDRFWTGYIFAFTFALARVLKSTFL